MSELLIAEARKMIERAVTHASEMKVNVSVAVVDASGHLVAFARMDDAPFMTIEIALGKAWTSAAYRAPSAAIEQNMKTMPAFASAVASMMGGKFTPRQGALPLPGMRGAVGVSGARSEQDEEIALSSMSE